MDPGNGRWLGRGWWWGRQGLDLGQQARDAATKALPTLRRNVGCCRNSWFPSWHLGSPWYWRGLVSCWPRLLLLRMSFIPEIAYFDAEHPVSNCGTAGLQLGVHPCAWCGTQDGHMWDFNPIAMGPPLGAPSFGLFPLVFERVPCPKCSGTGKVQCKACIEVRRATSNKRFQYKPAHPLMNGLLRTLHMRWKAALVFGAWRVQRFQQSVVSVNKKYVDCLPHEWPITPRGSPFHENHPTPPTHHVVQSTPRQAENQYWQQSHMHGIQPISPRGTRLHDNTSSLPGHPVQPISPRGTLNSSYPSYSYLMAGPEQSKRR
eukprot:jgi/Mesvir1/8230/Mv12515-RA.1